VFNRPYAHSVSSKVDNDAVAPDGTTTATKINPLNLFNFNGVAYNGIAEVTDVLSFFVKSNGTEIITGQTGSGDVWVLNIVTGSVVSLDYRYESLSAQYYGDGWWRVSLVLGSAQTAQRTYINAYDNLDGFWLWGFQCETSPIATSYMPTTISPFTRDRDDASMTNVSGLIGQKEGTLYVEVDWRLATGTYQYLLIASDGTTNNRVLIYNAGGNINMFAQADGGSAEVSQGIDSTGFSGIQKIAFAYKTDDYELYRNGSSVSSSTSGSLAALATLTDIDIGQSATASFQANMWIRAVQIIPRRLSNEQLIELTS
jgi:hypothetical protein